MESSEIAGLAASLAFVAALLIILLLVFLVRHGGRRRREEQGGGGGGGGGGGAGFPHLIVRRKKEGTTTTTTAVANGKMNGGGGGGIEMTNSGMGYGANGVTAAAAAANQAGDSSDDGGSAVGVAPGGTMVINGTTYAMPTRPHAGGVGPDVVLPLAAGDTSDEEDASRSTTASGGFVSGFKRRRKAKNKDVVRLYFSLKK